MVVLKGLDMTTVPTSIVDVNGKATTVHRKVDRTKLADGRISTVTTSVSTVIESPEEVWTRFTDVMNSMAELWRDKPNEDGENITHFMRDEFGMSDRQINHVLPELKRILTKEEDAVFRTDVHYRLFNSHRGEGGVVICVQDFDYYDYDNSRLIGDHSFKDEAEAERALEFISYHVVDME